LQNTGQRVALVVLFKAQHPETILIGKTTRRHSVASRHSILEQHSAAHSSQEHGGILYPLHEPNLHERGKLFSKINT